MAQMMLNGEQHDAVLIRGDENGGPIPVSIAGGVTLNGVSIGAEIEDTYNAIIKDIKTKSKNKV